MENTLKGHSNKYLNPVAISFIATLFLYIFVFALGGIAPLGGSSLTYRDGDQQYIDLLMYYKNVLTGSDSIFFSLGKYLGGNMYAAFTYYLASPFSLLVLLFNKSNMASCIDILVTLKACTASSLMAVFLQKRFDKKVMPWVTVLLSVSYSLNQYFIPQSSNYMWLDGAYMLPLMLLGVYMCINNSSALLAISTALSLSFNWYTGIINCAFCCFWALYEWFCIKRENGLIKAIIRFIIAMLSGVLASGIVLIPSLLALADRTHGTTNISEVFTLGFIGSPLTYFANYGPGLISTTGSVSVFAGSFVLVSVILYFALSDVDRRARVSSLILAVFGILMFYWGPLVFIFSVFREVESFWYRYGYLGIFVLVFIAASFWANPHKKLNSSALTGVFLFAALAIAGTFVVQGRLQEAVFEFCAGQVFNAEGKFSLLSSVIKCFFPLLMLGLLFWHLSGRKAYYSKYICSVMLVLELTLNSLLLFAFYTKENVAELSAYVPMEEELIDAVNNNHDGDYVYRVSQASNRCKYNDNIELGYNESLAYGFNGISAFLSSPEEAQGYFIESIGYDFASDTIPLTANTNIAADSLLGVQYVISDYELPGLTRITDNSDFKNAYFNPYALPMFFAVPDNLQNLSLGDNPYENLNLIYSSLLGQEVMPCEQLEVTADGSEFTVITNSDNPVYGWIEVDSEEPGVVSIDGLGDIAYNRLFAATSFWVPVNNGVGHFNYSGQVNGAVCYELNLEVLEEISSRINSNGAGIIQTADNEFEFTYDSSESQSLMMLLPYQDFMEVTINGRRAEVVSFEGVFPVINVDFGMNNINIKYKAPHMGMGIASTLVGVLLIVFIIVIDKKCDIIQTLILKKRA